MNMDAVLEKLRDAPEPVRRDFFALAKELKVNPRPHPEEGPTVMHFKGVPFNDCFTASRGDVLFAYQIMADHPLINPLDVIWA